MRYRQSFILQRCAALALLLLVAVMVVALIILPILDALSENRAAIEDARQELARYRSTLARLPTSAPDRSEDARLLLTASGEAVASANLQSMLQALAASRTQLRNAGALPPRTIANLKWVGIRLELQATIEAVYDLVSKIEQNRQPLLVIEAVAVRSSETLQNALSPQQRLLDVQLEIFAPLKSDM